MAKAKTLLLSCKKQKNTHTCFKVDEDKSSFLYLPSNVASQRYVSNTPSHFKIPLAKPLNFRDPHNWEVSLSELYFPSLYYNISQDNNSNLTIQYHIKGVVRTKNITIPQGHYDPASYVKEVNKEITKIKHKFTETSEPKVLFKGRLENNPNSRKITLVLNNHLEAMTFYGDNFRNMLGLEKANDPDDLTIKFEDELHSTREYYYEFPKSCSFNYKCAHMYVYSSLVEDSIVGNVFAPIVRVVGLEDKPKSEAIHREFTMPHYLPLRSGSFNEVVLELTDGMGNSMKFNQGNSVAVFHFKKKR